jgi:hypothetical protein
LPFSNFSTLQLDTKLDRASLKIYNSFGILEKEINDVSGASIVLSSESLNNGLYFISVSEKRSMVYTAKILVSK